MIAMTMIGRSSERASLSGVEGFVKNCKEWLNAKSETFSALCGENFTRREVLMAHAACAAIVVACGVAEWLEGGAL